MSRNILVIEHDPVLCNMFKSAFLFSGYRVQVTDSAAKAIEVIAGKGGPGQPLDLVVVDISEGKNRGFVSDVQRVNERLPVFALKHAVDKALLIELMNQKRVELIEWYIDAHSRA